MCHSLFYPFPPESHPDRFWFAETVSGAAEQICEGFSVELKHSSPFFLVLLFCFISHNYNMQP